MLSGLYIKLIASAIVLAVVGGAYFYVTGLQHKVTQLTADNQTLANDNRSLKDTIEAERTMNDNITKVAQAGDKQREQNKKEYQTHLKNIDDKVKAGKDRPVGPLLQEFFNE